MSVARRTFLKKLAAGGTAMVTPSLAGLIACRNAAVPDPAAAPAPAAPAPAPPPPPVPDEPGESPFNGLYGELIRSLDCPELEIPEPLRCIRLSSGGVASSVRDGLIVPNAFDGMAAFPLPGGNVRLIRNHEMVDSADEGIPIGDPHYDRRASGGTTSLEVRISGRDGELAVELVDEFVSLAGTIVNCAGGPTPWGSWLSCEETLRGTGSGHEKPHGYVFEVPVDATGPVDPVPLRAMGRFVHEAVAVVPATGIVYQTEDRSNDEAGFYRFIPDTPEVLADGGQLHAIGAALPKTGVRTRHQPALPYPEVRGAMERVRASRAYPTTVLAFEFLVLTACRSGKVRGARWEEMDLETREWRIPAERMKANRDHRVPLSSGALAVLREARSLGDGAELVFPSVRGRRLSDATISKMVRELGIGAVPHGFRSSFRDWAAECSDAPREVCELALAHVNSDRVEAACRRTGLFERRRALMEEWSAFLDRG